jgi:hypothetical protein
VVSGGIAKSPVKRKIERRTSLVRDNGFCTTFNESDCFDFSVHSPDVAMMEFIVMNYDKGFTDEVICKAAVPFSCFRQGIRAVQFYDKCCRQHGPFGLARLLVEVKFEYA